MRLLAVWVMAVMPLGAGATLKQTESLPSPSEADGIAPGPEGEGDDSLATPSSARAVRTNDAAG